MADSFSATALPNHIQQLLAQREQHTAAITQIDQTLAKVAAVLGGQVALSAAVARPAVTAVAAKAPAAKGSRRRRSRFGVSTAEVILTFVKAHKNPTTKEITEHLVSEGRTASVVSNALSVLTRAGELKRTPLGKGILGSRYSLA